MNRFRLRWFARIDAAGNFTLFFRTRWDDEILKRETYWSNDFNKWMPTSEIFFSFLVGNPAIVEVEYSVIRELLPEESRPKDPWANY